MQKSLARNSIYCIAYKLLSIGYPLITTVYISRILLPEGIGKIALVRTFVSYFTTLAALGIPNYGIKLIGSVQKNYRLRSQYFSELFIINALSTIVAFGIFCFSIEKLGQKADFKLLIVFSSLIVFNIFNVDWFYQGVEEYSYIAIRSTLIKVLSIILMLVFVRNANDYISYAVIFCFATIGNYFFNIIHIKKYIHFSLKSLELQRHVKKIFILFASVCASEIYTMLDSTMIGLFCEERELGYYSNSISLIRVIFSFMTAMCTVYFPRLSYLYKENRLKKFTVTAQQGLDLCNYFAFPATIGLIIIANDVVTVLFGNSFAPAALTIRILSILIIIFSVAYIAGHVILIAVNREIDIMYATIVAAVINAILNILLIRAIGYNGAGVATVCAEATVTAILYYKASKYVKRQYDFRYWISLIGGILFMVASLIVVKLLFDSGLMRVIISVMLGGTVFFFSSCILKNKIAIYIWKQIKKFVQVKIAR